MELNAVILVENRGHFGSGNCWIFLPRGFEIWGDQEIRENSNAEVSETTLERLESDLVLGKASPNSSSQCLDISLIETTPSIGKEIVLNNICSLLVL